MDPNHSDIHPDADGLLEVTVPGSDKFLEILRGVVGRCTRIAGFTYDGIEDLALAVDEAAVLLLESRPARIQLIITGVASGTASVRVQLLVADSRLPWPPEGISATSRWQVISALCESVWLLEGTQAGIGLEQTVR